MNQSKDVNSSKVVPGASLKETGKKKSGPVPLDKKELELFKETRAYRQIQAFSWSKGYSPAQTHAIVRKAINNLELSLSLYFPFMLDTLGLASLFSFRFSKEGQAFWYGITTQTDKVL